MRCQNPVCNNAIPDAAIKKSGRRRPPRFCSFACAIETRKAEGFYQRFSQAGIARQREIQAETGERSGHTKRSQAMREHNQRVPRRHVRGWHRSK